MNVVQTAKNGVVNELTIFHFSQEGNFVSANYSGGPIRRGYLVGQLNNGMLHFSYCQIRTDGQLDNGKSDCIVSSDNGKITLEEKFEMNSKDTIEKGTNIFKEI
ncbi:hypothetical protein J0X14_18210 [Muricauda sp. CAU 1633]|uniref:hypothetical protein n=1 Tax=Allomuricauda sp. CAU 1633 TaxID=2816036 RepID=UPI001A8CF917|nr:hypothetical protein [Muricauda sp. CAU 1633]MBO0324250.1 hypothetical protein [Muricauda sp. CAU 1633]